MIAKKFDTEIKLQKITISLYKDKKLLYSLKNHIFDYSDFIKLINACQSTKGQKATKSHKSSKS